MKTEEEARKLWCPWAKTAAWDSQTAVSESAATFNRPFRTGLLAHDDCRCIASDCMAWEWGPEPEHEGLAEYRANPTGDCGLKRRM